MKFNTSLHSHSELHAIASSDNVKNKPKIGGVKILGDSLSDSGGDYGMYDFKILGCIPLSLFLHKSPHKQFTNGYVWNYAFYNDLEHLRNSANPIENPNLVPVNGFFKSVNKAQGGAMAYNYGGILNLFKYLKGFFLSLILTNIQQQAKDIKKDKNNHFKLDDLCIIFAGANDLVTAGYCNKDGAERAIQGIAETIEILTTAEKKEDPNFVKNILVFTLPDFSKTPRFSKKTENARKQAHEACYSFNQGLKNLAKRYQYLDFTLCDIYHIDKKEDVNIDNVKKGILITGSGSTKKVYFVNDGQFILKNGNEITIDINLTKTEKKLINNQKGEIAWKNIKEQENLIHKLCTKAKLNTDVKIFDSAAVFEKIDKNPEAYGFTSGCSVYYLDKNQDKECVSRNITSGNAIIIKEINKKGKEPELCCFYVKNGKLIEHEIGSTRTASITSFTISDDDRLNLQKKLKQHPLKDGISQLIGMEDVHISWTNRIVLSAIEAYEKKFKEKIQLADIYASVLLAIKKKYPNHQDIFWDDLHPSVMVHFILEIMFAPFFKSNYNIMHPRAFMDDTAILPRISR